MNRQFEQVKEFHSACGIAMPDKPTLLENDTETRIHCSHALYKECEAMKRFSKFEGGSPVGDRASFILEELVEFMRAETIEDQVDALTDLLYFTIGTFTLIGVKPENIFDIVHAANMGKVGPDGLVTRNEQGKIQKPDGWKENFAPEPKIIAEIERQTLGKKKCFFCDNDAVESDMCKDCLPF